jgi:hypothetical protein
MIARPTGLARHLLSRDDGMRRREFFDVVQLVGRDISPQLKVFGRMLAI